MEKYNIPWTCLPQAHLNVSILDIVGANDDEDGGDNWRYETYTAPVKSLPTTNQHLTF